MSYRNFRVVSYVTLYETNKNLPHSCSYQRQTSWLWTSKAKQLDWGPHEGQLRTNLSWLLGWGHPGGEEGGYCHIWIYWYVLLWMVWFSSSLLWNRVYYWSESLGLDYRVSFFGWRCWSRLRKLGIGTQKYKKKSNRFCFGWAVLVTSVVSGKQLI